MNARVLSTLPLGKPSTEFKEQVRQHKTESKRVGEDMQQAFKGKDAVMRKELEEETRRLQEKMGKIEEDTEGMDPN